MFIIDCLIWSLINYIATKRRPELKDEIHQQLGSLHEAYQAWEILKESGRKRDIIIRALIIHIYTRMWCILYIHNSPCKRQPTSQSMNAG